MAIFGAGVFIEQLVHDARELGAGIFLGMFEGECSGDDLAAGIIGAVLVFLARTDGAHFAVELELAGVNLCLGFFERGEFVSVGFARHGEHPEIERRMMVTERRSPAKAGNRLNGL